MYCAGCGTPLAPGLSYCNRCGISLRERDDAKPTQVNSFLAAITIIGIVGLSLMLGGAIALKNGAGMNQDMIGVYMLMTFLIVLVVEFSLCWQLSRLNRTQKKHVASPPVPAALRNEMQGQQPRALAEPVSSVTENTTRTLEYSRNEPLR